MEAPVDRGSRKSSISWVEIEPGAIAANLDAFRKRVGPDVRIGAVVKSNAYGHGMLEVARVALDGEADWLCVDDLEEGLALRESGITAPVLILGYVALEDLDDAVAHDLRLVAYNVETIRRLAEVSKAQERVANVHLKIEAGTYRQGIAEADLPAFLDVIHGAKGLRLEGVSTHFANIEDTVDHGYAERQIAEFGRLAASIEEQLGGQIPVRHTACSAAALLFRRTHLDLVRVGISLYGLWPSRETYVSYRDRGGPTVELRPAMTWKVRIAQVKDVPEASFVGYGCTWKASRPSRIAIVPVGYHEGYDRRLSGVGHVLVRGRRAPIAGRICMNMFMIDVTDIPEVALEDEVVLLGRQGDEAISAEQLAGWCNTIPYEFVSRIHPDLPRVLCEDD